MAHRSFTHVFVKLDQSANTKIPQWHAYHKNCSIQWKIKVAICNHQADSPLYVWQLAWCLIWWFATFEKVCSIHVHTWHRMDYLVSQNNTNSTHTHCNDCFVYIFRRGSTKWLYWLARNGISRIANGQQHASAIWNAMLIRYRCSEVGTFFKSNVCDSSDVSFVLKLMQFKKKR